MSQISSPDRLAFLFDPVHRSTLDPHDAIERIMGDRQLLARMLARFRREYRHAPAELHACLARGEHESAHRLAHTLKGASGMIAAPAVHAAASEVEQTLRTGQGELHEAVARLHAAMDGLMALLTQLDEAATGTDAASTGGRPLADSATLLRELDALLEAGDGAAVDLVDQAGPALAGLLGVARAAAVAQAVHAFDFEAARAALQQE